MNLLFKSACLNPYGVFTFSLNLKPRLRDRWECVWSVRSPAACFVIRHLYVVDWALVSVILASLDCAFNPLAHVLRTWVCNSHPPSPPPADWPSGDGCRHAVPGQHHLALQPERLQQAPCQHQVRDHHILRLDPLPHPHLALAPSLTPNLYRPLSLSRALCLLTVMVAFLRAAPSPLPCPTQTSPCSDITHPCSSLLFLTPWQPLLLLTLLQPLMEPLDLWMDLNWTYNGPALSTDLPPPPPNYLHLHPPPIRFIIIEDIVDFCSLPVMPLFSKWLPSVKTSMTFFSVELPVAFLPDSNMISIGCTANVNKKIANLHKFLFLSNTKGVLLLGYYPQSFGPMQSGIKNIIMSQTQPILPNNLLSHKQYFIPFPKGLTIFLIFLMLFIFVFHFFPLRQV